MSDTKSDKELSESLVKVLKHISEKSKPLDPKIIELVNKNFWKLLDK